MKYVLIALLSVIWLTMGVPDYFSFPFGSWWLRATTYHFFHANVFHLAINCIAILSVFDQKWWRKNLLGDFAIGYVIATLMYSTALTPIIGMSNILFAVFGLRTPSITSPWWRKKEVVVFLSLNLLMLAVPRISAMTHITSMLCGVAVAELIRQTKRIGNDYRRATQ